MAGTIQTTKVSSRSYRVTSAVNGQILELGPAGTTTGVSTFTIQFNPDTLWNGQFVVMGRTMGVAADDKNAPFQPIPYRRVSLNNIAQEYAIVSDPISGVAMIEVPANGKTIGLLVACSVGACDLLSWDLQGNSAV